jgi:hypothetical protein
MGGKVGIWSGLAIALVLCLGGKALAQKGDSSSGGTQLYLGSSGVGNLRQPGRVGNTSTLARFGRVGGSTTRTFDSSGGGGATPRPLDSRASRPSQPGVGNPMSSGLGGGSSSVPAGMRPRHDAGITSALQGRYGAGSAMTQGGMARSAPAGGSRMTRGGAAAYGLGRGASRGVSGGSRYSGVSARDLLDRQMLVRSRSSMARGLYDSSGVGHTFDNETDALSPFLPEVESLTSVETAPLTVHDSLEPDPLVRMRNNIERSYHFYLETGDEHMRKKEYPEARRRYELSRTLNSDAPQPFARMFLASLYLNEYYQAYVHFRLALSRAQTLEDLRIDIDRATPSREDFLGIVRQMRLQLNEENVNWMQHLIYAYLAWLTNEPGDAQRYSETAARVAPTEPLIKRFQRLLRGETAPVTRTG